MSKLDIIAINGIHPFYRDALQAVYNLHTAPRASDSAAVVAEFTAGLAAIAPNIVGIAASGESVVPRALIEQLPALKVISVFGVGYDGIDTQAARERGVQVAHTPGVLTDDVADLAMGLVLCVGRSIAQADQHVKLGKWPKGSLPLATKVSGARLGVVGFGRIGNAVARRAAAFDMQVSYTARTEKAGSGYTYYPDATSLAANVDFLVLTTPGGAATHHLINAQVLTALGAKGFLINVARGSVVDQAALVDALSKGVIAGAGLDVFENEPHVPEALWVMPNVVLTPHMASATVKTRQMMANLAFANMQAGTGGQPVLTAVPAA